MFKKVVIADSLAPMVNDIFNNYQDYSGLTLWLGAIYFSFQIYCDFSGYSDIAIGTSKLFGFEIMTNFNLPYFSRNIGEFWRRWHISLSTWFRDYLYIPLGGSKEGKWKSLRNIFIIFLVSGFWHGANWTFIVWGLFHSILFIPSFVFKTNRKFVSTIIAENSILPSPKELFQVGTTFLLITIGWIFFRSETIEDSFNFIYKSITVIKFEDYLNPSNNFSAYFYLLYIITLLLFEYLMLKINKTTRLKNILIISSLILLIIFINNASISNEFIYFAF